MKPVVVIIGHKGEVGSALLKLYQETNLFAVVGEDVGETLQWESHANPHDKPRVGVMNVCIPFSGTFIDTVVKYHKQYKPVMVVVHSTVPIGTTNMLQKKVLEPVIHSPIRGTHPALYRGLTQFVKFFGAKENGWASLAAEHFKMLGVRTYIARDSRTTEHAKLEETSYYGAILHWTYEQWQRSQEFGTNYDDLEHFVRTTNDYVPRPCLYPPKDGVIGGHCVVPNAKLLQAQLKQKSPYLEEIIKMGMDK